MVYLLLDGNSDHVARAWKKVVFPYGVTALDLIKCRKDQIRDFAAHVRTFIVLLCVHEIVTYFM